MLARFHPLVEQWFEETFGEPSDPQRSGWPAIATGSHTLILAPTGTGKTLAAEVLAGELSLGESVHQKVDAERRDGVRANHSATHLLHAALRRHLGTHVSQKGSLVAPDYFRFDFSHPKALSREEVEAVEAEVNAQIRSNEPVTTRLMEALR